jgi:vitamin-K-epoxide reductase (warfarin-sensitive)
MITALLYGASIIGGLLSLYTLYLHWKLEKNKAYTGVCDLSDRISCTKTIQSPYGKIFGIPNGVLGVGFYLTVGLCLFTTQYTLLLLVSILSALFSCYLAYMLFKKLKLFCIVCTSIYVVNAIILLGSILLLQ